MKIFIRDIKGELKTAMRVAILTVAAIAGNSQTAQAKGGILNFLETVSEAITEPVDGLAGKLREINDDVRKVRHSTSGLGNEINNFKLLTGQTRRNIRYIGEEVSDVYNSVAPKQSHRQGFAVPNENPSQTRGQENEEPKNFEIIKAGLHEKMERNEQNLAKLNGNDAAHQKTVGDKRKNKVKEADHQENVGDTQKNKVKSNQSNEVSELSTPGRLNRLMSLMDGRTE